MLTCGYCGTEAVCVTTKEFYGRDYGANVWKCTTCDAYVGTHKGSKVPLGTLANKDLRALRNQAHAIVDPYWQKYKIGRHIIYKMLGKFMGTEPKDTHIGMYNDEQCTKIIQGFKQYMSENYEWRK